MSSLVLSSGPSTASGRWKLRIRAKFVNQLILPKCKGLEDLAYLWIQLCQTVLVDKACVFTDSPASTNYILKKKVSIIFTIKYI